MGTRADFYVGRGESAEWLGSIAHDGYPDGHPEVLLELRDETAFRQAVTKILVEDEASKGHATTPEMGWPWPWDDSSTTDYAYAFEEGAVRVFCFGRPEGAAEAAERAPKAAFPDMSARKAVTYGPRSGLIILAMK
jgi:hypothetical protein